MTSKQDYDRLVLVRPLAGEPNRKKKKEDRRWRVSTNILLPNSDRLDHFAPKYIGP